MRGVIKRLVFERGFGFVTGDDGKEYFFHRSQTAAFDTLTEGESRVSFEIEDSARGPRAVSVEYESVAVASDTITSQEA